MLPQDMDVGGENGVPLSRLVAFCCIREGERIHRGGRGGRRGGRGFQTCPYGRGEGERAAPPRSSAALSFEGRFQTCPYHRPGGDDSPQRARGARRGEGRDSRGRATTRVAPTGGGRGMGKSSAAEIFGGVVV